MNYELHPLCTLFPRMTDSAFADLKEDIAKNGLRELIVLHDGMILDGGNRYKACIETNTNPSFIDFDGDDIVSFVLSANLHRRHLSPGQQAAIVASVHNWEDSCGHGGVRRASDQMSTCSETRDLSTSSGRAKVSGASIATQRRADAVAKADPELIKQVVSGSVSLGQAIEQVAPSLSTKPKKRGKKPSPVAKQAPPEVGDSGATHELEEAQDTIRQLAEENADMRAKLALTDLGPECEEIAIEMQRLRTRINMLELEVSTLKIRRDSLMGENTELKRQASWYKAKLDKMEKANA
jgi:hypothetical protein